MEDWSALISTSHPKPQSAKFIIKDKDFPATSFFKDSIWQHTDELYNFKKINPDVKVLITIDESTYEGGTNGAFHPMSWYHDYDGGRAFYTELGHVEECYTEENYLKHLLGGIQYAWVIITNWIIAKPKHNILLMKTALQKHHLSRVNFLNRLK